MYYPDLSNECEVAAGPTIRAVGWLSAESPFPTGSTPTVVVARLKELIKTAFQPVVACGWHECDICQFDGASGSYNLFLPGSGCLYVCPELIVHYISAHYYRPPKEFMESVLASPDATSMEYKKAFLAVGGGDIMRGAV